MCGRFSLSTSAADLVQQFDLPDLPAWSPRYNISPTQDVLALVRMPGASRRQTRLLRWGFIPRWAEGPAVGSRMINARAETVTSKAAYRHAFRERRCLVLADGFYEWKLEGGRKQPFHIRRRDGRPFAFAGLWERWAPPDGQPIDSCALLTTAANDLIRPLHVRMPVILSPSAYGAWLDPGIQDAERLQALLRPFPPEDMLLYAVGPGVNDPANDAPDCILPLR